MKKIFILLIVLTVVFPATLLAECKTKPPTRTKFEEIFGKSAECYPKGTNCFDTKEQKKIECPTLPEGTVCYRKSSVYFKAIFDTGDNLKQLNMWGNSDEISNHVRLLIPESWKGLWAERERRKTATIKLPADETEKFSDDCLELENGFQKNQMTGYVPYIMNIKWK